MKNLFVALAILLAVPSLTRAQDAATEEQLNRLRAELTALQASDVDLQKRLSEVLKELQELRVQAAKPAGNFAGADDVQRLAEAIKEVDRKREADRDLILDQLKKLSRTAAAAPVVADRPPTAERGYEYVVQSGDTISAIVQAYRNEGVKVTIDDVLNANKGLKPTSLKVGQKIFIPHPTR